uniref:ING domain-containing protein n=1 Tax=Strongyloides papillosus TaxID=174720 RepID=A0A0N5B2P4_STREA
MDKYREKLADIDSKIIFLKMVQERLDDVERKVNEYCETANNFKHRAEHLSKQEFYKNKPTLATIRCIDDEFKKLENEWFIKDPRTIVGSEKLNKVVQKRKH